MALVICSSCGATVPERKARRELTVWARTGRGGTFSDVRGPKPTGRWRCDDCQRAAESGGTGELFATGGTA